MAQSVGAITTVLAVSLLATDKHRPTRLSAAQQAPPTIRSRTTLVPIDIRVVDLNGKPVSDLKKEDFIVQEDGVRRESACSTPIR